MTMGLFGNVGGAAAIAGLELNQRQEALIANNLANYDTPGYHAQTLVFKKALAKALARGPAAAAAVKGQVVTTPGALRLDGSNVSMTQQMALLAEAQLNYQVAVQSFNYRDTEIKIASEGRPQ